MSWARRRFRSGDERLTAGSFDLIVNTTTVGMGASGQRGCGPQEPAHPCRFVGRDTPIGGPRLRARRDGARQGGESARRHGRRRARGAGSPGGRVASHLDGTGPPDRDDAPGRQSQTGTLTKRPDHLKTSARHGRGDRPQARRRPRRGRRQRAHRADAPRPLGDVRHRRDRRARLRDSRARRRGDQRGARRRQVPGGAPARAQRDRRRSALAGDRRALRPRPPRPQPLQGRHGGHEPALGGRRAALQVDPGRLRRQGDAGSGDGRPGQRAGGRRHPDDDRPELPGRGRRRGRHRGPDRAHEHARERGLGGGLRGRGARGRGRGHRAARVGRRRPGDQAGLLGARPRRSARAPPTSTSRRTRAR